MKKNKFMVLVLLSVMISSCKKEDLNENGNESVTQEQKIHRQISISLNAETYPEFKKGLERIKNDYESINSYVAWFSNAHKSVASNASHNKFIGANSTVSLNEEPVEEDDEVNLYVYDEYGSVEVIGFEDLDQLGNQYYGNFNGLFYYYTTPRLAGSVNTTVTFGKRSLQLNVGFPYEFKWNSIREKYDCFPHSTAEITTSLTPLISSANIGTIPQSEKTTYYTGFQNTTTKYPSCSAGGYAHFMEYRTAARSFDGKLEFKAGLNAPGVEVGGTASAGWSISSVFNSPTDYVVNINVVFNTPQNLNNGYLGWSYNNGNAPFDTYMLSQLEILNPPISHMDVHGVSHGIQVN